MDSDNTISGGNYSFAALATVASYGLAFIACVFLKEPPTKPSDIADPTERIAANPKFSALPARLANDIRAYRKLLPYVLAGTLLAECSQFVTVFLSQLQYRAANIPLSSFGYLHILLTLSGLSSLASSWLCRTWEVKNVERLCFVLAFISCLLLGFSHAPILSVLAMLVLRAAARAFAPLELERHNHAIKDGSRPWLLSVLSMEKGLAAVPIYLLFGEFSERSLSGGMLLGAGFALLGFLFLVVFQRREKYDEQQADRLASI